MPDAVPTLQIAIRNRLLDHPTLRLPEASGGLGITGVYAKWLKDTGDGSEPDAYTGAGIIKPAIVVLQESESRHPSPGVPGLRKGNTVIPVYIFAIAGEHQKNLQAQQAVIIERWLCARDWQPVIVGGARPDLILDSSLWIDDEAQFPGNVVLVQRYRAVTIREVW